MGMREKLIEILSVPIYPHELVDPIEAVADYLIDNGVTIPVRCKDCKKRFVPFECGLWQGMVNGNHWFLSKDDDFWCAYGERRTDDKESG
jgi:hypothetical protein